MMPLHKYPRTRHLHDRRCFVTIENDVGVSEVVYDVNMMLACNRHQALEELTPHRRGGIERKRPEAFRQSDERLQGVVQLVGVAYVRPGAFLDFGDGRRVEFPYLSQYRLGQGAPQRNCPGAPLLERSIVEVCVRIGVQYLV